jgi:hypothetical protein
LDKEKKVREWLGEIGVKLYGQNSKNCLSDPLKNGILLISVATSLNLGLVDSWFQYP